MARALGEGLGKDPQTLRICARLRRALRCENLDAVEVNEMTSIFTAHAELIDQSCDLRGARANVLTEVT